MKWNFHFFCWISMEEKRNMKIDSIWRQLVPSDSWKAIRKMVNKITNRIRDKQISTFQIIIIAKLNEICMQNPKRQQRKMSKRIRRKIFQNIIRRNWYFKCTWNNIVLIWKRRRFCTKTKFVVKASWIERSNDTAGGQRNSIGRSK